MHINRIKVMNYWVSFDIESVKANNNGQVTESVQAVATFTRDGEQVAKIYNLRGDFCSSFAFCTKLLDDDFAKQEAEHIIESANKSAHSPFLS